MADNPNTYYGHQDPAVIAEAVRQARTRWDLNDTRTYDIGNLHPGAAAVTAVRAALGHYRLPNAPTLRYTGMKRESGHGGHKMDDGVVWVEATLRNKLGHNSTLSVPCLVHGGKILDPEIMVHNGRVRVIAQSTFDDITGRAEIYDRLPDRNNMFAPPPAHQSARPTQPKRNDGMFGFQAASDAEAKCGKCGEAEAKCGCAASKEAAAPHGTEGPSELAPGQRVKLKNDVVCKNRGGGTWKHAKGTSCTIIRDMCGDGMMYYVDFGPGKGKAPISGEDLA